MITSFRAHLLPSACKRVQMICNSPTRHYSWFNSSQDSTQATNTRVQVVFAPEIITDEPNDNPALVIPQGEQTVIPFKEISPILLLRAFLKNVTLFDTSLESIISDADKLSPLQIMEIVDSKLVSLKYSLNLAHVLTYAFPNDHKYGVLDDMYHSCLKHEVYRFNPLTYGAACEIVESSLGTNSKNDLRQLAQFYRAHGKLYGFHLGQSAQESVTTHYRAIQKAVNTYMTNVNSCLHNEAVPVMDENVIKALPENFATKLLTKAGIRVPLHPLAYETFMTYCPDKATRRRVWVAYNSKPSMASNKNNSQEFEKLRDSRHRLANTLGHINYAEMIISQKMAGSLEVVRNMIDSIYERTRPKYDSDLAEIDQVKAKKSIGKLELWDLSFLRGQCIKQEFGSKTDVSRYFPLEKALSGVFQLVSNLFNVSIEHLTTSQNQMWSPHVRLYRLTEADGKVLGHFYFDPYCQRASNLPGSNIIELTNRSKTMGTTPLCAAFLSKKPPIAKEQQILLSYPEFLSLLSMMGRILTIVMNQHEYFELSTVYNVPKDRLDVLGHTLFLYGLHNYKAIQLCSSNITNGEPLPESTHQLLRDYVLSHESIGLTYDIFLSALDVAFYTNTEFWREILPEIWRRYMSPFELAKEYAYPLSFVEIVSNNGAASYYSKIWSQMIGSDVCSKFLENNSEEGIKETGKQLKETILSTNSSLLAADMFREFRGRDPSIAPFLELYGLSFQSKIEP